MSIVLNTQMLYDLSHVKTPQEARGLADSASRTWGSDYLERTPLEIMLTTNLNYPMEMINTSEKSPEESYTTFFRGLGSGNFSREKAGAWLTRAETGARQTGKNELLASILSTRVEYAGRVERLLRESTLDPKRSYAGDELRTADYRLNLARGMLSIVPEKRRAQLGTEISRAEDIIARIRKQP